jgi:predicted acetyltransferase
LYLYDFSEFTGFDLGPDGRYNYKYRDNYWMEANRHPFFIKTEDKIAGFVLVNLKDPEVTEQDVHSIAEFFILKKYRNQGVGKSAVGKVFDMFPGNWRVVILSKNVVAQQFWRKVIKEYTDGKYQEILGEKGPVITFKN